MANASGVSISAISLVERGWRIPTRETLRSIAEALDESVSILEIECGLLPSYIVNKLTEEQGAWSAQMVLDALITGPLS